ncbi:hypothetical protein PtB15_6B829 [Puccinia triticina]|nr:hypothetical protein PtB15_6B829 [Puccinia triticina]
MGTLDTPLNPHHGLCGMAHHSFHQKAPTWATATICSITTPNTPTQTHPTLRATVTMAERLFHPTPIGNPCSISHFSPHPGLRSIAHHPLNQLAHTRGICYHPLNYQAQHSNPNSP